MKRKGKQSRTELKLEFREFAENTNKRSEDREYYISEWFLERFLVANKDNLVKAKAMIKGYFDFRDKMETIIDKRPELYGNIILYKFN